MDFEETYVVIRRIHTDITEEMLAIQKDRYAYKSPSIENTHSYQPISRFDLRLEQVRHDHNEHSNLFFDQPLTYAINYQIGHVSTIAWNYIRLFSWNNMDEQDGSLTMRVYAKQACNYTKHNSIRISGASNPFY